MCSASQDPQFNLFFKEILTFMLLCVIFSRPVSFHGVPGFFHSHSFSGGGMNPQQMSQEVARTKSYVTIQELSDLESDSTSNVEEEEEEGIEDGSEGSETASVGNVQPLDSEPEGNLNFCALKN